MDFSSFQTWLDLSIVLIGAVALGAAAWAGWQLFGKAQPKSATLNPALASRQSISRGTSRTSKPVMAGLPIGNRSSRTETVMDRFQGKGTPMAAPAQPDFLPADPAIGEVGLIAAGLQLEGSNLLKLTLKNTGPKVIFKRIKTGTDNEVKVEHLRHLAPLNTILPEYPTGTFIGIALTSDQILDATYQFTIYYGDLQGNLYRQEISGLGKEYPIIEKATPVA